MNNMEKREWRTLQIVVSEIKKYNQNAQVESSANRYYDLLVTHPEKGVQFGIEIVRSNYSRTHGYSLYIDMLRQHAGDIAVPIILMSVNEASEEVRMGIVFSWFHQHPLITQNVSMRKSSIESWDLLLSMLSLSSQVESPIQFLQMDKFFIKKNISLTAERVNGHSYYAELVYLRRFSPDYRMNTHERNTQQEIIDFLLHGYNSEEFPSDLLDEAIYQSVRERFDIQPVHNQLILMNTELRDLQRYQGYHRGLVHISITPRIGDAAEVTNRILGRFNAFVLDVDLYAQTSEDMLFFNEWSFSYQEELDNWVTKVIDYRAALKRYKRLSEVIS